MLKKISAMDSRFMAWMDGKNSSPFWIKFFATLTHLGDLGLVWLLWAVCLIFTVGEAGVLLFVSIGVCALVCNLLMKPLFARSRPFEKQELDVLITKPSDRSFPSGHTMASFTALAVLWSLCGGWQGWLALLIAGIIAFSRLYLLVHHLSDVVCGAIFGLILGKLCVMYGQLPAQWGMELLHLLIG